ncbi:S8 family serine peptidase [Candidatus Woesearchaeota archaeon]|nr:S8 family serine peptidase [Candidatus Woesearchaeota archaeon]
MAQFLGGRAAAGLSGALIFRIIFFLLAVIVPIALADAFGANTGQVPITDPELEKIVFSGQEVKVLVEFREQRPLTIGSLFGAEPARQEIIGSSRRKFFRALGISGSGLGQGIRIKHSLRNIPVVAASVTEEGLQKLLGNPSVKNVRKQKIMKISLADSVPQIGAGSAHAKGYRGEGQTICILDTGIDYTHPALGSCTEQGFLSGNCSKVIAGHDFINGDDDPMDDNGHGTHVAGIAAGTNMTFCGTSCREYEGAAPGSKIVAMKVCDSSGSCPDGDMIAAIDSCTADKGEFNISVISISIGDGQYLAKDDCRNGNGLMAQAIDAAAAANISVVAATGNRKFTFENASGGISAPACLPNATSVGSIDPNDESISYMTFRAPILDFLAPGNGIISARSGNGNFTAKTGTSMAVPHVSGAIAILKEAGPSLAPDEIKKILNDTGKKILDPLTGVSFSRINVSGALAVILARNFTLFLEEGWNLISFPSETAEGNLSRILSFIDGEYSRAASFNNSGKSWSLHIPNGSNASGSFAGSLTSSSEGGIWIYINRTTNATFIGEERKPKPIRLQEGWNLASFPIFGQFSLAEFFSQANASAVYAFQQGAWRSYIRGRDEGNQSLRAFSSGFGYWIKMDKSQEVDFS